MSIIYIRIDQMLILGIETSCDETAASVVKDGREVLSNVLYSQINEHKDWGGVIPEHASRLHYTKIHEIINQALKEAQINYETLDAIAVTTGPGLMGSLLIGVNAAQTLAWIHDKPLIPVDHLYAHICSNFLGTNLEAPFLCLLASGGHTQIIELQDYDTMITHGVSIDDAVGEAFDKTARLMNLAYPGGPELDKLAQSVSSRAEYKLPIPKVNDYNFSFSGLKTAVLRLKEKIGEEKFLKDKAKIAYAFQESVSETLIQKVEKFLENSSLKTIVIAGGVSANSAIRKAFLERFSTDKGFNCYLPKLSYCTDNAAMVAAAGYFKTQKLDISEFKTLNLTVFPKH